MNNVRLVRSFIWEKQDCSLERQLPQTGSEELFQRGRWKASILYGFNDGDVQSSTHYAEAEGEAHDTVSDFNAFLDKRKDANLAHKIFS